MHTATDNIIRLVKDRYTFQYPGLKEEFFNLPSDFYHDMVIVFQNPDRFNAKTFDKYPLELVLSYLRITHSFYLDKRMGEIEQAIEKLNMSNNNLVTDWYPCMVHFMTGFNHEMTSHIAEEEKQLFPYIDLLIQANRSGVLNYTSEQKVCLMSFMLDHDDIVEEQLKDLIISLDEQSGRFSDSFSYRMLLNHLKTFELDLRIHARMEEEVLIPRSIVLEKEVLNNPSIRIHSNL